MCPVHLALVTYCPVIYTGLYAELSLLLIIQQRESPCVHVSGAGTVCMRHLLSCLRAGATCNPFTSGRCKQQIIIRNVATVDIYGSKPKSSFLEIFKPMLSVYLVASPTLSTSQGNQYRRVQLSASGTKNQVFTRTHNTLGNYARYTYKGISEGACPME